jgi:transcriptional regulator with XRE-family HTH domain
MTTVGRPMLASALSKAETGERRIDVDDLDALARALAVTPHNLMGWDDTPPAGEHCGPGDEPSPGSVWVRGR